jgi:predicted chitinase
MIPLNDGASLQLKEGDYVIGFYMDGKNSQVPIIMGLLPGIPVELKNPSLGFTDPRGSNELSDAPKSPVSLTINSAGNKVKITEGAASRYPSRLKESTLSRLARNEKIIETPIQSKRDSTFKSIPMVGGGVYDEPSTPYATVYPYNRVMETESGHILEFDDTPGAERIHIYHRSGTSDEYHPDGTKVTRINADAYEVVLSDKHVYINGDIHITAKNDVNIKAGKNVNIEAGQDVRVKASGAIKTQAVTSQIHYSAGAMALRGIPMNLNGPILPPLGLPSAPISVSVAVTTALAPVTPDVSTPGNQVLAQRPGANLGKASPNVLSAPTESPVGIPAPKVIAKSPVTTLTATEGADVMIRAMNRNKIRDPIQRAAIYAQTRHETRGFRDLVESFAFTREGLLKTWGIKLDKDGNPILNKKGEKIGYFDESNVDNYLRNGVKIASRVYGNRMGNASEESQDGWKYRGRGFIHLTGKSNYSIAATAFNQDFVAHPDAVAIPDMAADIACWYFTKGPSGQGYRGSYDNIKSVTTYVNGGLNGLTERTALYTLAKSNTSVITFQSALV